MHFAEARISYVVTLIDMMIGMFFPLAPTEPGKRLRFIKMNWISLATSPASPSPYNLPHWQFVFLAGISLNCIHEARHASTPDPQVLLSLAISKILRRALFV
jgi:hypothetical protein